MASKRLYDTRAKSRQDAHRTNMAHLYRQHIATSALVARAEQRIAAAYYAIGDTDWCAFPPATSPYAPMMAGMARGVGCEVVYVPSVQRSDLQKLAIAAARLAA